MKSAHGLQVAPREWPDMYLGETVIVSCRAVSAVAATAKKQIQIRIKIHLHTNTYINTEMYLSEPL